MYNYIELNLKRSTHVFFLSEIKRSTLFKKKNLDICKLFLFNDFSFASLSVMFE